jgi:hypothetical protein
MTIFGTIRPKLIAKVIIAAIRPSAAVALSISDVVGEPPAICTSHGSVAVWELNGTSAIGSAIVGNPGLAWDVTGTGDYNGDGFNDIRFQNSSGKAAIWEMNGTNVIATASLGNPGPRWHVTGGSGPLEPSRLEAAWVSRVRGSGGDRN